MSEYVQWDDLPKNQNNNSGGGDGDDRRVPYLRLKSGNTYKVRPIYFPVMFHKYFHTPPGGKLRTAICADPATCPVKARHGSELKENQPSLRYASYVIDRSDGKVKILEGAPSIFRPLGSHMEATGRNPGGTKDGSDWQIKVTGTGKMTRYEVTMLDITPLSPEEKKLISDSIEGDITTSLTDVFSVDSPEEIEKKLFGAEESSNSGSSQATTQQPAAAASTSGGDDGDVNW